MDSLHLYLFRDLPEIVRVDRDHVLFRHGDPAEHMYVVIEGAVDLLIGDAVVETSSPGAFIGELALIDNAPRSATAVARPGARIFPIDQDKVRTLVQQSPQFAIDVMRAIADRLRRANARMATPSRPAAKRKAAAKPARKPAKKTARKAARPAAKSKKKRAGRGRR